MGQRNVERHLVERRRGIFRWRAVQGAVAAGQKEKQRKRETDTNQQIARSSQRKRRSPANWAKRQGGGAAAARRLLKLAGRGGTTRGRKYAIKRVRDTKQKRTPRREIDARGGCS